MLTRAVDATTEAVNGPTRTADATTRCQITTTKGEEVVCDYVVELLSNKNIIDKNRIS